MVCIPPFTTIAFLFYPSDHGALSSSGTGGAIMLLWVLEKENRFQCHSSAVKRSEFVVILVGHQTRPILMSTRTTGWCSSSTIICTYREISAVFTFTIHGFLPFNHPDIHSRLLLDSRQSNGVKEYNTKSNRVCAYSIIVVAIDMDHSIQVMYVLITYCLCHIVDEANLLSKEERSEFFQSCGGCDSGEDPASFSSTPGILLPTDWLPRHLST